MIGNDGVKQLNLLAGQYNKFGLSWQPLRYTSDQEQLHAKSTNAAVVLMPSRAEGHGLAAQEALAAHVPVLIARDTGLAELLNELGEVNFHTAVVDNICSVNPDVGSVL